MACKVDGEWFYNKPSCRAAREYGQIRQKSDSVAGEVIARMRKLECEMAMIPTIAAASSASALGGLLSWAAVAPTAQLFGKTICRTGDASTVALTFDDGPNPAVTPQLLGLLGRYDVRASFFLIGKHVKAFPSLAKEIAARGHAIGNHTYSHPRLTFLSPRRIAEELSQCDAALEKAIGIRTHWMRPPFGFRGPQLQRVLKRRGDEQMVMWSRWARDWKPQPAEPVIERLRSAKGGDIVLLHDGDHRILEGKRAHVVGALEYWLPRWKDAGIRFVTLEALNTEA